MSETKQELHKRVITEYYRIKNERDYDALDAIMSPNYSASFARHFGEDEPYNAEYLKDRWWAYVGAFPDLFYDVHQLLAEGDWVVARLHYTGQHDGVLNETYPPTHKRINVNQSIWFRFDENDKIVESHSTADFLTGLWKPLGIEPPMGDSDES